MKKELPFPDVENLVIDNKNAVVSLFGENITKDNIYKVALKMATDALDGGEKNPLHLYVNAKIMVEFLNCYMHEIKSAAIDEAELFGSEGGTYCGIKFEPSTAPTKYAYKHDENWEELHKKEEEIKKLRKEYEEKMKVAMKNRESNILYNGKQVKAAAIKTGGGSSLRVTMKK